MTDFLNRSSLTHPDDVVDFLFALYAERGDTNYDESVTQSEHALQAAALAEREQAPAALVAAGLLHDIGHLVVDEHDGQDDFLDRDAHHERIALRLLSVWLPAEVTQPIALHVAAKRYLVSTDPAYAEGLSTASRRSLTIQGGPMSADEATAFERCSHWQEACKLRRWDDDAKAADVRTPGWEHYRPIVRSLIRMG